MAGAPNGRKRPRGTIDRHGDGFRVRVSAGSDPATGERLRLMESVTIAPPGDRKAEQAAYREAQKALTRLQSDAESLKVARTKSTFGVLLDRWLAQHELDATTRMNYESVIRRYVHPALGDVPFCC